MERLHKERLKLICGDTSNIEIVILDHQPEGKYIYRPDPDDVITMKIYKPGEEPLAELNAFTDDSRYLYFDINSADIPAGKYLYDVTVKMARDESTYHIVREQEIVFEGGSL